MGKGALKADKSSYERNCATHGAPLGGDAYINTINNLGGDPENHSKYSLKWQNCMLLVAKNLKLS